MHPPVTSAQRLYLIAIMGLGTKKSVQLDILPVALVHVTKDLKGDLEQK